MITSINEFAQYINEVRLPQGYFKVINTFTLPDTRWDVMFNKDNIVEIDTVGKSVKKWTNSTGDWTFKEYPYLDLMQPHLYKLFKDNTVKLAPEETPELTPKHAKDITQFTTTVKRFNKKAAELGLEDSDKIKVIIL